MYEELKLKKKQKIVSDFLLLLLCILCTSRVRGNCYLGTFKHNMWLSIQRKASDGIFSLFPKGLAQYHHEFLLMAFIYFLLIRIELA